ncbi:MAG: sodium:solute symporter family protein [Candidatus Hydrogenedentes bacterium]|nr:sodium:solute symporter family protein [Candidatus Hydrogenedentota bacterium]
MEQLAQIAADTNFAAIDWGIVVLYLVVSVAIGLIANRYVSDMADYVVAGRGIRTALGIATLTGTELGLITVMYNAEMGFTGGFAAFHIALAAGLATLVVGATGFILTGLRRHEVLTIPEFYGKRFGPRTRILGGVMLATAGILNMGLFLGFGAKFIVGITGLQSEGALLFVMGALLVLVLFYTVLGGMVSVVLTDYFQFVVLSFGLILATGFAVAKLGWGTIFTSVAELKGAAGFNPLVSESSFGIDYVLWMLFLGAQGCAVWPTSVARALACESEAVVKKQFMWASLSYAIRVIVPCFWGVCAYVFVMQTPALREAFFPADPAQAVSGVYAMPVFLGRILPVGFIGLLTAAMIAAFMSTHDSYFLCWSSVITNDVIAPVMAMRGKALSQRAQVTIARVLVVVIGVMIFIISYAYPLGQRLWDFMAVSGGIYFTGAFAVLAGGLYWKRASSTGAVLALIGGGFAVFGLKPVQRGLLVHLMGLPERAIERFTGARVGLAAVVLAFVAVILGSLLFPDKPAPTARET